MHPSKFRARAPPPAHYPPPIMQPAVSNISAPPAAPSGTVELDSLGFAAIVGDVTPRNQLLQLIAERIRVAAALLQLSRDDLHRIFSRHSVFEGETSSVDPLHPASFILVETHHLIQGKVGKGALKLIFPVDLLGEGFPFRELAPGVVEVLPTAGQSRWPDAAAAEQIVKEAMREFMTGESFSMSLKCQATGAPFSGSEGLVLCAIREFDRSAGRYFLKPTLHGDDAHAATDKALIEEIGRASCRERV